MVIDGKKRDTALLSKNILYAADIRKLNDPFEDSVELPQSYEHEIMFNTQILIISTSICIFAK